MQAHTGLLFSRAGRKPTSCSLRPGKSPRLRRASRAPCLFLPHVSHARGSFRVQAHAELLFSRAGRNPAPAVSKSRTVSLSSPRLARTRFFPGVGPHRASVFPGKQKSHLLFPAPGRKPAPNFHEYVKRGAKRSPTHRNARKAGALLLGFSSVSLTCRRFAAEWPRKPASSQTKGKISKRVQTSPFAQKRSKKLSSAPWLFRAFPLPAGGLRPNGRVSRPAAREKGRSAAGHRNGVQRGEALLRIFVYFLFGRK